ncbi:MAG: GPW/gp25 family protein [Thaumarchaeota archaeon]|uniref:GPW/gp25 family protein n=1 Tax=Candidatus Nitrosotalea sp. TS TaxID=2341020 RepID=UPI00140DC388|nr:GPW/gp25 family protein [Candidatus Nitrosotalea sp. TS]MDE1867996.1 GPW/gp25 family protein [Nitrososphaerota archaeon]NHI03594.1 hypothetical protein [Candidatus Nitrosotalea sp. TS]
MAVDLQNRNFLSFSVGSHGGIGLPDYDESNLRNMIISVLLTSPGERVNHPEFGCGLKEVMFAGNSPVLNSMVDLLVREALNRWLADLIEVNKINTEHQQEKIILEIVYTVKKTLQQERLSLVFEG